MIKFNKFKLNKINKKKKCKDYKLKNQSKLNLVFY